MSQLAESFPDRDDADPFGDGVRPGKVLGRSLISGGAMLVIGLIIFEATADPALGVAAACLKFGVEDWRAAAWLRRVDLDRPRAWACGWMFVASGFWKATGTAIAAAALIACIILLSRVQRPGFNPIDRQISAAMVVALAGFGLASLAAAIGFAVAIRYRVQIWVGPEVHRSRRRAIWPPSAPELRGRRTINQAKNFLTPALCVVTVAAVLAIFLAASRAVSPLERIAPFFFGPVMAATIITPLVVGPFLMLLIRDLVHARLAPMPELCWPFPTGFQAEVDDAPP